MLEATHTAKNHCKTLNTSQMLSKVHFNTDYTPTKFYHLIKQNIFYTTKELYTYI